MQLFKSISHVKKLLYLEFDSVGGPRYLLFLFHEAVTMADP